MPKIVPIVEGDGDVKAVPVLLRRILAHLERYDWGVAHAKKAGSLPVLTKRLQEFLRYAQLEPDAGAVLILLDLDDGCPKSEAQRLAREIRRLSPQLPVAIVFAHREYETWFLASITSIVQHQLVVPPGNVETIRGAKEKLEKYLKSYKETVDQEKLSSRIDLYLAEKNSRSFRRLLHAVEFLVSNQGGQVSP